jgi:uncharacterized protein (DUF305 family)
MNARLPLAAAAAVLLLAAGAAFGQGMRGPSTPRLEPHLAGQPPAVQNEAPSTTENKAAMDKMMGQMDETTYTGQADRDFVSGMLPHHQGAVDMAKIELKYGKDPQLLKLAQSIIDSQEREIALMEKWQAQHPPKP